MEWQPIETAPKDGTPILVLLEKPMTGSFVHAARFGKNVSTIGSVFSFDAPKAIAWMHQPPLPKD